jgi:hypothetical protein
MTPSAFERVALANRNAIGRALSASPDVETEARGSMVVAEPVGASCARSGAPARARALDVHPQRVDVSSSDAGAAQTTKAPLRPGCSGLAGGTITPLFTPTGWNRLAPPSSVKRDARSANVAKRARKRDHVNPRPPLAKVDVAGSNPVSRSNKS